MKMRNEAQSLAASSKQEGEWSTYRELRNSVTGRLRSEEANWQSSKLQNSSKNGETFWGG